MSKLTIEVSKDDAGNVGVKLSKDGEQVAGGVRISRGTRLDGWPLFDSARLRPDLDGLLVDILLTTRSGA